MNKVMIDLKEVGGRIKDLRHLNNLTQEEFSNNIFISTSYLALIEAGRRTASIDVFTQISYTCHVSLDYLFFGVRYPKKMENEKKFDLLCECFSEDEISSALMLAEFYLKKLL